MTGLALLILAASPPARAEHSAVRHKSGPVSIRGGVAQLHGTGFTLKTTTHGSYVVEMRPQTQVTEKGKRGHGALANNDHVRVRGFLSGRTLTAISVEIIPVKPKASSLRAIVETVSTAQLTLRAGGKTVRVALTPTTKVDGAVTSPSKLQWNDRVRVRVVPSGSVLVALSVHVFQRKPTGQRVQLHGTVVSTAGGGLVVSANGKRHQVTISGQTTVHEGSARGSPRDLKAGESVTVYACCVPGSLTATSIHIFKPKAASSSITIRGTVQSVTGNRLSLKTSRGMSIVVTAPSTSVTVGSTRSALRDIRVGDEVSVHASTVGASLSARSIHVYAQSRAPRTIDGTVGAVTRSGLTVSSRDGKRYLITVGRGTAISEKAKRIALGSVHTGDRVRATGRLTGTTLVAVALTVTPALLPLKSVRGLLRQVTPGGWNVVDEAGTHYLVRAAPGVKARLKGKTAPVEAIFPGVTVRAKGHLTKGTLIATSISITVAERTVHGRITRMAPESVTVLATRTGSWTIDLGGTVTLTDGSKRIAKTGLHVGAYVRIRGYQEKANLLRAVRVAVTHPQVTIAATVKSTTGGMTVRTAAGETYALKLSPSTVIAASRGQVDISAADIPTGVKVRVEGTVSSDGLVRVSRLTVRLPSFTVRGRVTNISLPTMIVEIGTASIHVTIGAHTTFFQTVHQLTVSDVVAGDDVTVYGYKGTSILARKLMVHRKRVTVSGKVDAMTSGGFTLTAVDGAHQVILSSSTVVVGATAGQQIAVGNSVRVSGYLRGDGVILARRITITGKP
jgi:hypothetical protein